jgi:hypothetical protein
MKVIKRRRIGVDDLRLIAGSAVEQDAVRELRAPLLEAFDIYKTNVIYGIESETVTEKESIRAWYNALLNLDASALLSVPDKIAKYIKGGKKR